MSMQDYLISYRMKKACDFLSLPQATISNVAYSVGYDPLTFSKIFKRTIGVSPTEYRKQLGILRQIHFYLFTHYFVVNMRLCTSASHAFLSRLLFLISVLARFNLRASHFACFRCNVSLDLIQICFHIQTYGNCKSLKIAHHALASIVQWFTELYGAYRFTANSFSFSIFYTPGSLMYNHT